VKNARDAGIDGLVDTFTDGSTVAGIVLAHTAVLLLDWVDLGSKTYALRFNQCSNLLVLPVKSEVIFGADKALRRSHI
jgi:hypothetical protein